MAHLSECSHQQSYVAFRTIMSELMPLFQPMCVSLVWVGWWKWLYAFPKLYCCMSSACVGPSSTNCELQDRAIVYAQLSPARTVTGVVFAQMNLLTHSLHMRASTCKHCYTITFIFWFIRNSNISLTRARLPTVAQGNVNCKVY